MDESYLDNLLNEFSLDKEIDHKIEDELDEQIQNEKERYQEEKSVSREEAFNYDLEQDAIDGVPDNDFDFSEDQIDELDNLDNLADLDIGDLDFSDIDFDDLDITKLNTDINDSDFDALLKDFEGDLEIPSLDEDGNFQSSDNDSTESFGVDDNSGHYEGSSDDDIQSQDYSPEELSENSTESLTELLTDNDSADSSIESDDLSEMLQENTADLNEDNFDADSFLDSLLNEESIDETKVDDFSTQADASVDDTQNDGTEDNAYEGTSLDELLGEETAGETIATPTETDNSAGIGNVDEGFDYNEDDLFSMLDMRENGGDGNQDNTEPAPSSSTENSSGEPDVSALEGLEDLDDLEDLSEKPKKKKRSLMEILFGEPDEDDEPTEEELKAKEEKKAAKKAKKEAAKEKKKAAADKSKEEKSKKDSDKKSKNEAKKKIKAAKKAKKKAEDAAEAAKEKKLNKPAVIFIFSILLGGVGFMYLSSIDFNYKMAIQHAANYFANQKYHKAYDEIKGVDVKEKDKPLKDRIYTVMYVERLYESYENNIELGRNRKALDSLLRGVSKYYEYYDDAKELDIVNDIDYSFAQIKNALEINYGISIDRAQEINELDDYEYMKIIREYTQDQDEY